MAAATAVAVGAIAGVAGSAMQAKAANKASERASEAARLKPTSISGLGMGEVNQNYNAQGGINTSINQNSQLTDIQKSALDRAQATGQPLPPEVQQQLDSMGYNAVMNNQGLTQAANDLQIDTQYRDQALGMNMGAAQNSQALGGLLTGNAAALAQQGPQMTQQSDYLMQRGQGMLESNFDQQRDQQLALLREQAAPYEQQAMSSFQNDLFKRGMLNDSTGSGLLASQFGQGLARADLDRQQAAIGLGNQMTQQDRAMGANLMNQGINTGFAGMQQNQSQLNAAAGLAGQMGQQGAGLAQNAAGIGLQFDGAQFNRAQNRIQNSQNMLGFANQAQGDRTMLQQQNLGLFQGIDAAALNAMNSAQGQGGIQAQAGANQARYLNQNVNPWAQPLNEFGQGLMQSGISSMQTADPYAGTPQAGQAGFVGPMQP